MAGGTGLLPGSSSLYRTRRSPLGLRQHLLGLWALLPTLGVQDLGVAVLLRMW